MNKINPVCFCLACLVLQVIQIKYGLFQAHRLFSKPKPLNSCHPNITQLNCEQLVSTHKREMNFCKHPVLYSP